MGKFRNEIGVHPEQRATYVGSGHFIYAPTTIFAGLVGDSITSVTLDVGFAVKASGSIFFLVLLLPACILTGQLASSILYLPVPVN